MKLVIAECSAVYAGRADSVLPAGIRAIMVKADGSVSIHSDQSNKPLNYMKSANQTDTVNEAGEEVWTFDAKQETLVITLHKILNISDHTLMDDDPGTTKDGTEKDLQDWLSKHPEVLGKNFRIIAKEYQTGKGPVDLLALDADNKPVAVEVKRVAALGAVDQCRRYITALKTAQKDEELRVDFFNATALLVAVEIRPNTLAWAANHNIPTVTVPANWREIK